MADDITKEYLNKEGLTTLVEEIQNYALQKTSVEYSKEYSFDANTSDRLIMVSVNTVSAAPFLVTMSVETGAGDFGVEFALHGTVVVSQSSQGSTPLVNIYDDATGELANCIKYSYSESIGLKLYVIGNNFSKTVTLHIKAVNTEGIDFSVIPSSTPISHLDSPKNVLVTAINDAISDAVGAVTGSITSFEANRVLVSNSNGGIQASNDITTAELNYLNGVTTSLKNASHITEGTLPVVRGGTGQTSHTANAVLTGNSSSAVKNVTTKSGAFYATTTNGAPKFGTLPVAQGGTGATSLGTAGAILQVGADAKSITSVQLSGGAFYCPSQDAAPRFETLPIEFGGTGATSASTARANLGIHRYSSDFTVIRGATNVVCTLGLGISSAANVSVFFNVRSAISSDSNEVTNGTDYYSSMNIAFSWNILNSGDLRIYVHRPSKDIYAVNGTHINGYVDILVVLT